jgi:ribosomal protein L7/L12
VKYQLPPEVLAAWERGEKVVAIRALREATGLGLKEAKAALDSGDYTVLATSPQPRAVLPPAVLSAMARGDKIEAIKLARETTGLGLKEAKEAVEAAASSAPAAVHRSSRSLSPGEVPRGRINWLGVATFFALGVVVLLLAARLLRG